MPVHRAFHHLDRALSLKVSKQQNAVSEIAQVNICAAHADYLVLAQHDCGRGAVLAQPTTISPLLAFRVDH